ncbi:single-stranded DNA-binding protein WHY1, chloroplastic-like [Nymphaea colorata]|nr:single-stranded DNA-binding protein WHY1, chloroplastic-like [Nymphaea colorata]
MISLTLNSPLRINRELPCRLNGVSAASRKSFSVRCRRSDSFESQKFTRDSDDVLPGSQTSGSLARVFVGHSIFKGKAALTVEPRAPEFASLDSGAFKLSREGSVILQFAPAVGTRQYDWNRKQVFSLSITEIGTLISLGMRDSCEFFHDPFKGKSDEGKIRKVLKVEPFSDGTGYFFNLSVSNKLQNVDESIYIPITKAEFTVLISACNFILPYLMGWQAFAETISPEDSVRWTNSQQQPAADLEWNR